MYFANAGRKVTDSRTVDCYEIVNKADEKSADEL
jgi:hypothetical protein